MTTQSPSPISIAPAFSPPALSGRAAPSVGKRRSSGLAVLVAAVLAPQRAEHPQLDSFGSRPSSDTIWSYSSTERAIRASVSASLGMPSC